MSQYYTKYGKIIHNHSAYAKTGAPMYEYNTNVNINQKTQIYKLNLEDGKKYVGKTTNVNKRMNQHFSGNGAKVTQKFKPINGEISIDSQKISDVNLSSLRKEISIVDQNTTLFDDTVFNNIKYAKPDASDDEIFKAAELSMSEEFINRLENGFKTKIGENGVKLSGGEKLHTAFISKSTTLRDTRSPLSFLKFISK